LRKIIRTIRRLGQDNDAWPVVLLLLAVLGPAVCLFWFMLAAIRNEHFASRQRFAEICRVQLSFAQTRLQQHWTDAAARLEKLAAITPASGAFERCVESGLVDSIVLWDGAGHLVYPNRPAPFHGDFGEGGPIWVEASRLEHLRQHTEAAKRYQAVARETTNTHAAARALQSAARCLVQAGQFESAIHLIHDTFGTERYRFVTDPRGRLIAANVEWLALDVSTNWQTPELKAIARRLSGRLTDYDNPVLAAPQRRFLMKEMQRVYPDNARFQTLRAEELAEAAELSVNAAPAAGLRRGPLPDVWQLTTPDRRFTALFRSETVLQQAKAALTLDAALPNAQISLVPPDREAADSFVTLPAGALLPGWRLALSLQDRDFFEVTAGRQAAIYWWTAILVVAGMSLLALIAARLVRRQMTLARLKNDLAATVSHELKTPLSSMRVLVETLLAADEFEQDKVREYLQLIAQENERLGRLIQNFLTFSRMERNKYAFHFESVPVRQVVETALDSVRGRLEMPGCRLEVEVESDLPAVRADPGALAAALANLLENAFKYSEEIKHILLRARAENDHVIFSVADNGIGIPPREWRKIFQPFYQVDQRLSRQGSGCGLGLSIVQFITSAHHGTVSVHSRPGGGSTFLISIPVSPDSRIVRKEAIA